VTVPASRHVEPAVSRQDRTTALKAADTTALSGADTRTDAGPLLAPRRYGLVDAARGVALLAMAIYHFSWDLAFHGYLDADVGGDLGWRLFARSIAASFLFLVGVSLVLAARRGLDRERFLRRLALVAVAAAAITVATIFVFPQSYIFFGILHCIAVASVLALPFLRLPVALVVATAAGFIAAPFFIAHPIFDHPALLWVGLGTYFPQSNDYVPLFPWFGAVLAGIAAARLALAYAPVAPEPPRAARAFVWSGRHSLAIYLIHQPLLFALVALAAMLAPPAMTGEERGFARAFGASCVEAGSSAGLCEATAVCLAGRLKEEKVWDALMANGLDAAGTGRYYELANECFARAEAGG
jgi:uncharacterized membrane protein